MCGLKENIKSCFGLYKECMGEHVRILMKNEHLNKNEARIKTIFEYKPIMKYGDSAKSKIDQYRRLFRRVDLKVERYGNFIYYIDEKCKVVNTKKVIDNMPLNYSLLIEGDLSDLKMKSILAANDIGNKNKAVIEILEKYIRRICREIKKTKNISKEDKKYFVECFLGMLHREAKDLKEALQRILFVNQIFWQTGHRLIGLGRLDKTLDRFKVDDESYKLIKDFLGVLHKDYNYKSSNLMLGDTGQNIVLGGLEKNGVYFWNEYTYMFLKAVAELHFPDPKTVLRVSKKMPKELLYMAVDSIRSGIGSPLLSNDDVVVPALIKFGYAKTDAYDYGVSACWEPLIPGKSLEQNNIGTIEFARCIVRTIDNKEFVKCNTYEEVCELFYMELTKDICRCLKEINEIEWENDPLLTLITSECLRTNKDIAKGGALYNNYGLLSVGLATAVNSLINIRKFVFEERLLTLQQFKDILNENFVKNENFRKRLQKECVFGKDEIFAAHITKEIMEFVSKSLEDYQNRFGGRVKFGLSSPSYVDSAVEITATSDGRKQGEPYAVHISAKQNATPIDVIRFAGALDYNGLRANGNVADIVLSSNMIQKYREKFVNYLWGALKEQFFQVQFNVLSYRQLMEAKCNPEKYPCLIVRVWGFSAYFIDLPEAYQNCLIERAKLCEGIV